MCLNNCMELCVEMYFKINILVESLTLSLLSSLLSKNVHIYALEQRCYCHQIHTYTMYNVKHILCSFFFETTKKYTEQESERESIEILKMNRRSKEENC